MDSKNLLTHISSNKLATFASIRKNPGAAGDDGAVLSRHRQCHGLAASASGKAGTVESTDGKVAGLTEYHGRARLRTVAKAS
jgi:hypothetical protein